MDVQYPPPHLPLRANTSNASAASIMSMNSPVASPMSWYIALAAANMPLASVTGAGLPLEKQISLSYKRMSPSPSRAATSLRRAATTGTTSFLMLSRNALISARP